MAFKFGEPPNERIVDRAVEIWKRLLSVPKYEAESPGERTMPMMLASSMASMLPSNATPEILDKFGDELKTLLMTKDKFGGYQCGLHTDYGPDGTLNDAAQAAGLKMEFPWKTNMWIHQDSVSISGGYGAETVYHYPLSDGRWLVTKLTGSDIQKIVQWIESGESPEFEIEDSATSVPA